MIKKYKTLSCAIAFAALSSAAQAAVIANAAFDGVDTTVTMDFVDATPAAAGANFFLTIGTPGTGSLIFAPDIVGTSTITGNTILNTIAWTESGAFNAIQFQFGGSATSGDTFTGDFAFTLAGGDFSAMDGQCFDVTLGTVNVPEPSSAILLGFASLGLLAKRRRA